MSKPMVNPHDGMVAFQKAIREQVLDYGQVKPHDDLIKYLDQPSPDEQRLTFARVAKGSTTVTAYVAVIPTGMHNGLMCFGLGYAVPEAYRGKGYAVAIVKDAIAEVARQMRDQNVEKFYVDAIVGIDNVASQHVAQEALGGEREEMVDEISGQAAYRWTREVISASAASF